jgi:hypothetical protein
MVGPPRLSKIILLDTSYPDQLRYYFSILGKYITFLVW